MIGLVFFNRGFGNFLSFFYMDLFLLGGEVGWKIYFKSLVLVVL